MGDEIGVRVYRGDGRDPVAIAREGIQDAIDNLRDVVIIDTAGRLHVDADMMEEAQAIKDAFFGPVTPQVPASILQYHPDFTLVADEAALSLL